MGVPWLLYDNGIRKRFRTVNISAADFTTPPSPPPRPAPPPPGGGGGARRGAAGGVSSVPRHHAPDLLHHTIEIFVDLPIPESQHVESAATHIRIAAPVVQNLFIAA